MKHYLRTLVLIAMTPLAASAGGVVPSTQGMARIEGGTFRPLFSMGGRPHVTVKPFAIDSLPVSQAQFFAFARRVPRWSGIRTGNDARLPATNVPLEAAAAYCSARGVRLATTDEWEYVAQASDRAHNASSSHAFRQRALELALRSRRDAAIGSGLRNIWGVRDIHGGVSEWTSDVQHFSKHGGHGGGHKNHVLTCGSGVTQTGDAGDYAAFMRYAVRATANAERGSQNIGFRCAASL
jgi:sulfatase modifying factor 1